MKILILGDNHGRPFWREIVKKEKPDLTIFLGDYVTTHEHYTPEQQIEELEAILDYKEKNPDKVIILIGNHDLDGLGYYWAQCRPSAADVRPIMNKHTPLGRRFLRNAQWFYVMQVAGKPTLCAHAGVTQDWLDEILKMRFNANEINKIEPDERFGFTGDRWDNYGTHPQQSCTWIRPETLMEHHIKGWDQIVGHTGTHVGCRKCRMRDQLDDGRWVESDDVLWECDAQAQKAYLIIEDDKYIPKSLNDNV